MAKLLYVVYAGTRVVLAGAGRSLIDERDIASVAVRALTEDGHVGARYVLTGPEVLSQAEQLAAIGRPLAWQELSKGAAVEALAAAWGDRATAPSPRPR
jgi:uncharacterized protein YbjT (DUF2867 family)